MSTFIIANASPFKVNPESVENSAISDGHLPPPMVKPRRMRDLPLASSKEAFHSSGSAPDLGALPHSGRELSKPSLAFLMSQARWRQYLLLFLPHGCRAVRGRPCGLRRRAR